MCDASKLRSAVESYAYKHGVDAIPYDYYHRMVITWNGMNAYGQNWDVYKAAAALLFEAHKDGYIHETQITPAGLEALDQAHRLLQGSNNLP